MHVTDVDLGFVHINPYVLAALIAALASITVNGFFAFLIAMRSARVNFQNNRTLQNDIEEIRKNNFNELEKIRSDHEKEVATLKSQLQIKEAKEIDKHARRQNERERQRADRLELIERLRAKLVTLEPEFRRALGLTPQATDDEVIDVAHRVFGQYSDLRELMGKLRGKIRASHYRKVDV
ncbi:hypothetical protein, partial [Tahibacter soli]